MPQLKHFGMAVMLSSLPHLLQAASSNSSAVFRPRAVVYMGSASDDLCSKAAAGLLESSPLNFQVRYAGESEGLDVTPETLRGVSLYAQPCEGYDGTSTYSDLQQYRDAIRDFVSNGGRYLGLAFGASVAGNQPGYGLLPQHANVSAANLSNTMYDTDSESDGELVQVDWSWSFGPLARSFTSHWMYAQGEASTITGLEPSNDTLILGRYAKSGGIAASVSKFGKGWVGLIGASPEAPKDWFDEDNMEEPDGLQYQVGYDFIEALMAAGSVRPIAEA